MRVRAKRRLCALCIANCLGGKEAQIGQFSHGELSVNGSGLKALMAGQPPLPAFGTAELR
jgi:hypothetical protein